MIILNNVPPKNIHLDPLTALLPSICHIELSQLLEYDLGHILPIARCLAYCPIIERFATKFYMSEFTGLTLVAKYQFVKLRIR